MKTPELPDIASENLNDENVVRLSSDSLERYSSIEEVTQVDQDLVHSASKQK